MPSVHSPWRRATLLALATGSGAAALIYQIVWMRRLVLVFGSTTLATSTVLVTFLGGLAIGAWLWGKVADRYTPWAVGAFGLVEAATGVYGLASIWLFAGIEAVYVRLYPAVETAAGLGVGMHVLLSAAVIVPAAALMGGTVPLLVRAVASGVGTPAQPTGALYGWNTLGAAAGTALATYGLLPAIGLRGAVALAAVGNLMIGAAALLLDASERRRSGRMPIKIAGSSLSGIAAWAEGDPARRLLVLQALGASGLAAMTYEVTWARVLSLMMGSSVYAFGALVVVLLAGLGIGSALYARVRWDADGHLTAFGIIELLIAVTAVLGLITVPALPEIVIRLHPLVRDGFSLRVLEHLGIAASIAFVPALLLGATFPAAVGALGRSERLGRTIGRVYGASTAGTVLGAYLAGFVLIPSVGLRATIVAGVIANLVAGALALLLTPRARTGRASPLPRVAITLPALAVVVGLLVTPPWRRESLVVGGALAAPRHESVAKLRADAAARRLLFYQDGISATLSVEQAGAYRVLRINGRTNASTLPADMLVQVLPAHLPMLWHPAPRRVFIVGLGSGITAGAVARYPIDRVDVAELEPSGPSAARFFDAENRGVLSDGRVRVWTTDARARLQGSPDRYDVIISIPSHLWVAGTAVLYTREFYEIVRARLAADGMFVQWVQKAGLAPQAFRLVVATFQRTFPHTSVWSAGPTHALLLGSQMPQRWDLARVQSRMARVPGVAEDLRAIGLWHPLALFASFVLGDADAGRFTAGIGRVLTDDWPTLEFSAPRTVFDDTAPAISAELEAVRRGLLPAVDGFDAQRIDARTFYLLGFAYASLGRTTLAIETMEAAVRESPNVAAYHVGLANQYLSAGRRRDALASYQAAIRADPRQSEALLALGTLAAEEGARDAALRYYRLALEAAPDLVQARMALAKVHAPLLRTLADAWLASGRPDLAVDALTRAAALAPDAGTYAALGGALLRAGRPRDALDAAGRGLALDPSSPAALDVVDRARAALRRSR